jgi:non-ribosomal peptide synthetase component E (peptide arylation enzyme)
LHTGDIVRVDDAGRVHIVDRIKDIIIMVARTFPASMSNPHYLPHLASRKPR